MTKRYTNKYIRLLSGLLLSGLFFTLSVEATNPTVRERIKFDEGWQFHKGDIAIKRAVQAGRHGGLTDADVKIVESEATLIAYTDRNKVADYKPSEWQAVYKPGKMKAVGYKNGKKIAGKTNDTTGAPFSVTMVSDTRQLNADGCDVAIINIAIKDAKGRVVPTADNPVEFLIEGPGKIIGTGNGNPSSHEPEKENKRKAFNGYCQVLVQSDKTAGAIRLKAVSEGLKPAEILINTQQ
ncbi:MAG TPA: hypothetical protein DEQ30_08605 [Porphyromonadaceae bacterium]|nr:hypothetical protein [Porphyromonadaceae bacterium]